MLFQVLIFHVILQIWYNNGYLLTCFYSEQLCRIIIHLSKCLDIGLHNVICKIGLNTEIVKTLEATQLSVSRRRQEHKRGGGRQEGNGLKLRLHLLLLHICRLKPEIFFYNRCFFKLANVISESTDFPFSAPQNMLLAGVIHAKHSATD